MVFCNSGFSPKQPFMVKLSSSYYKKIVNNYGISHFYSFQLDEGVNQIETSVPDGCVDIIFHYSGNGGQAGASIYGSPLEPHSFDMISGFRYFGVRFLPGNSPMLVDASVSELINQVTPLSGDSNLKLTRLIAQGPDFETQVRAFFDFYLKELEQTHVGSCDYKLNQYLLKEIIQNFGNVKISELAEKSGYSVRYINRVFKEAEGISPKNFCRIIRFQCCMNAITHLENNPNIDADELVCRLGYCDQSHMIREFKEFSKRTPLSYLEELKAFDYVNRLKIV